MYKPKHKQPVKTPAFLSLETKDFDRFTAGEHVKPRGRHALKAADSILRVSEIGERQRRASQAVETPATVAA